MNSPSRPPRSAPGALILYMKCRMNAQKFYDRVCIFILDNLDNADVLPKPHPTRLVYLYLSILVVKLCALIRKIGVKLLQDGFCN